MRVGSLFAGVGGFDLGFERAGMTTAWHVEIDPKCREVLAARFPAAAVFADVREVGAHNLGPVDVICGGFPCQDLSIAGKRAGLDGARSGLFYEMTRIVDELKPAWLVWENVPGLLSSGCGADMYAVLVELERIGYHGAWTTLDARHFGVAQRRRRIFGVFTRLDSGAERAAEVLALSARMCGNPAPRSEAGARPTGTTRVGFALRSDPGGTGQGHNTNYVAEVMPALQAGSPTYERGDGSLFCVPTTWPAEIAPTLNTAYGDKWGLEDQNALSGGGLFVPVQADAVMTDGGTKLNADKQTFVMGALHTASGRASTTTEDANQIVVSPTVTSKWAKGSGGPAGSEEGNLVVPPSPNYYTGMGVRRLTPTECERLQGFPDGWTEGHADSHRYRMMGNAVCVPCATWIGKRLMAVDALRAGEGK